MDPKNEKQLQSAMVVEFSQRFPEKAGLLWHVRNTTLSQRDGITQKAMGMRKGVADLNYYDNGVLVGIEVKFPGKNHDREQVEAQYIWGETITGQGGEYYIVTSIEAFLKVISGTGFFEPFDGLYKLSDIKKMLDTGRKSLVFN